MKIESSTIGMSASRAYTQSTTVTQATRMTQTGTGSTTLSGNQFGFSYAIYERSQGSGLSSSQDSDASVSDLYSNLAGTSLSQVKSAWERYHEEFIQRLEEFMERIKEQLLGWSSSGSESVLDLTTTNSQPGTLWTRQQYESTTYTEAETTAFQGSGSVVTTDGRSIDFQISMEMSRSFTQQVESLSTDTQYVLTDPLVVHLENAPDTISDQTWYFDLDNDGKKEEISQLAAGTAFLALDANGNGKIDNGSELFGATTGNGFQELSAYDEDGNGWIDENDSVYSKLNVWQKDASGADRLLSLQQSDIGAIYLGAINTQFSHNSLNSNETQAVVRQTGFYLHESDGSAGAVQQIDFATKKAAEPGEVA